MFVSFRKCSRPQKPDPISDHNCQNLYPFSDQNDSKTIPFRTAHTYIPYIGEYPPRGCAFRQQKKTGFCRNRKVYEQNDFPSSMNNVINLSSKARSNITTYKQYHMYNLRCPLRFLFHSSTILEKLNKEN